MHKANFLRNPRVEMSLLSNSPRRVVSGQAQKEETLLYCLFILIFNFFWPHVRRPRKAILDSACIANLFQCALKYIQSWLLKKLALETTLVTHKSALNITNSDIAPQPFSMSGQTLHCTLHSTLSSAKI